MRTLLQFYPGDGVALVAASALVQAAAVALLVMLLCRLGRRNPAFRYGVCICGLACVLVSPLTALVADRAGVSLVTIPIGLPASPAGALPAPVAPAEAEQVPPADWRQSPEPGAGVGPFPPADMFGKSPAVASAHAGPIAPAAAAEAPMSAADKVRAAAVGLLAVWAAGAALLLARLAVGWRLAASLRRRARPLETDGLRGVLAEVRRSLCAARLPEVLVSHEVAGPVSIGVLRPLVLLPTELAENLTHEQLRDVLVHECAHVLKRDHVICLLQRLTQALYWPHPLVYCLSRRLCRAREEVCDNHVLAHSRPCEYAETLLAVAGGMVARRVPATIGLLPPRWRLEQRVGGLLDSRRRLATRTSRCVLAAVAVALLAAGVFVAGSCRAPKPIPEGADRIPAAELSARPSTQPATEDKDDRGAARVTCRGKVVDAAGEPIGGASVRLWEVTASLAGGYKAALIAESTTKADGAFAFAREVAPAGRSSHKTGMVVARKAGLALDGADWTLQGDMDVILKLGKPATMAGQVVDEAGKPVAGAQVGAYLVVLDGPSGGSRPGRLFGLSPLSWLSVKTDAHGRFAMENVPAGSTREFLVSAPGRVTLFTLPDQPGGPGLQFPAGKTDIRIVLPLEARIEGSVVDPQTGRGVGGVKITARGQGVAWAFEVAPCVSDNNGRFSMSALRPGSHELQLAPPDEGIGEWVAEPVSVTVEAGKTETGVTIEVGKGGLIEVLVTDEATRRSVQGVVVIIHPMAGGDPSWGITDQDGIAHVLLTPGEYEVASVSKSREYQQAEVNLAVTVVANRAERVAVQLKAMPKITGTVRDLSGKPVAGAKVRLLPGGDEDKLTDARGRFEIRWDSGGLSADRGQLYLFAAHEGLNLAAAAEIEPGAGTVDVKLQPAVALSGRVIDADGKPIGGAGIEVSMRASSWGSPVAPNTAATDSEGRYQVKALAAGQRYQVQASAAGYGQDSVASGILEPAGKPAEMQDISLALANLCISGVVVDDGGKPAAGARISISGEGQQQRWGRTDAAGKFTLKGVCKGHVYLRADTAGPDNVWGNAEADAGAADVKVVVRKNGPQSQTRPAPEQPTSLLGKPVGKLQELGVALPDDAVKGKRLLICFWDMDQRPSRYCMTELAKKADDLAAKGVVVIAVHASAVEADKPKAWLKDAGITFPAGCVSSDAKEAQRQQDAWGVAALPWLILTDAEHVVRAEGFGPAEVDEMLRKAPRPTTQPATEDKDDRGAAKFACKGKVVDEAGKPVGAAVIKAYEWDYDSQGVETLQPRGQLRTPADGAFSFEPVLRDRPSAHGLIVARKEGLAFDWDYWLKRRGRSYEPAEITLKLGKAGALAGTVADESGSPIAGAEVRARLIVWTLSGFKDVTGGGSLDFLAARTDAQGGFAFSNVPRQARAEFYLSAPGYAPIYTASRSSPPWTYQYAPGQKDIRITLPVEAKIEGTAVDKATGKPVVGVTLLTYSTKAGFDTRQTAVSGGDGRFSFASLLAGPHVVEVMPPREGTAEWVAEPVTVTTEAGRTSGNVKVELSKGGLVEVAVTDQADNKPLSGAYVQLGGTEAPRSQSGTTGKNGIARIRLLPGAYRVQSAGKPSYVYRDLQEEFEIVDGGTQRLSVQLTAQPVIRGIVTDPEGRPAAGAAVRLLPGGDDNATTTGEDGKFELTAQLERLRASRSGGTEHTIVLVARHAQRNLAAAVNVQDESESLNVALAPAATLAGRVTDPMGKPVGGARVSAMLRTETYASSLWSRYLTTDVQGRYEIKAIPRGRKYMVRAQADGFGTMLSVETELDEDEAGRVEVERVVLQPANLSISGLVVGDDGMPFPNARVMVASPHQPDRVAVTDKDGKFVIEQVIAEEVFVQVDAQVDGQQLRGSIRTKGGEKDVKIILGQDARTGRRAVTQPTSLIGKPLPKLEKFNLKPAAEAATGKKILLCFWDMDQRPSRHCMTELAKKAHELAGRGVVVVAVHASAVEAGKPQTWLKDAGITFPAGCVPSDAKEAQRQRDAWGVGGLPWLILTDAEHVVRAEGFGPAEVDEKIKEIVGSPAGTSR